MTNKEILKECRKLARQHGYVFRELSSSYDGQRMYGMYDRATNTRMSVAATLKTWESILYGELGYL